MIKDRLRGHWNALCSYLVAPQCDVRKATTDMAPDWSISSRSPVKKRSFGVCCGHGLLREGLWIWRSFSLIHPAPCFDPQEETSHSSTFEAPEQSLQESFGSFDQDSFYLWLAADVEVVQSATAQFCSIMIHNIDSSGDASWSPLDLQGWPWVLLHCTFIMPHVYCCSQCMLIYPVMLWCTSAISHLLASHICNSCSTFLSVTFDPAKIKSFVNAESYMQLDSPQCFHVPFAVEPFQSQMVSFRLHILLIWMKFFRFGC